MKQLAAEECKWSGQQFRALNEAPTILLVLIVLLAVFKNNLPVNATVFAVAGLIIAMVATIQLYAKKRRQDQMKLSGEMAQE